VDSGVLPVGILAKAAVGLLLGEESPHLGAIEDVISAVAGRLIEQITAGHDTDGRLIRGDEPLDGGVGPLIHGFPSQAADFKLAATGAPVHPRPARATDEMIRRPATVDRGDSWERYGGVGVKLEAIGVVHSIFTVQTGTPVQPAFASGKDTGTVEVFEPFEEGLDDLERFDRIWLLCWLDRSGPSRMKVVPYLDTETRGLFSTRSPSRPNPIGMSAVRLLRREGRFLHVAELDILDGTPLLDIKPYSAHIDVFPAAEEGWLGERVQRRVEADERFGKES